MTKQVIFYTQGLRYEVEPTEGRQLLLGASEKAQVYLPQQEEDIRLKADGDEVFYQFGEETGLLTDGLVLNQIRFCLRDKTPTVYDLLDQQELRIGAQSGSSLQVSDDSELLLQKNGENWHLTKFKGTFYRNNILEKQDQLQLSFGDELSFGAVTIKIYPDEVWLSGPVQAAKVLSLRGASRYGFYPDYPDYHRSPRIIYRGSEDKMVINPPGKEPGKPNDELLKLIVPPLLMIGVVILITLIQPRGIYILATMAMSAASIVFSVRTFFKNRKKYKADKKERVDLYRLYLKDKAIELTDLERKQRQGMLYHFPKVEELTELTQRYTGQLVMSDLAI